MTRPRRYGRRFGESLERESRRQLRIDLALGTLFFAAGAAVSYVLK